MTVCRPVVSHNAYGYLLFQVEWGRHERGVTVSMPRYIKRYMYEWCGARRAQFLAVGVPTYRQKMLALACDGYETRPKKPVQHEVCWVAN